VLYNVELGNLQRQTGTILEAHGVRFYEERYRSIGPLCQRASGACYPRHMAPTPNADLPPPAQDQVYQRPEIIRLPPVDPIEGDAPAVEELPPNPAPPLDALQPLFRFR
jgi:hypothetical protein